MDPEFSLHTEHSVLEIEGKPIGHGADCYVIAEIGHNHQGSVEQAMQMIAKAHECGADAVKLQKRHNSSLYTADFYNRPYESESSFGPTYGMHREALEFGAVEYRTLQEYAQSLGVTFFATAFDFNSADMLAELDMPAYKIASGDVVNTPLLRYVAEIGKPVIFSTGCATLEDVLRAYDAVAEVNEQVVIMQCTAGYPAEWSELDLGVIRTYGELFPDAVIGFSSHDNGISMPVAAYMLGARIVEKHFTLNRTSKGTDHAFSLEPVGLRKMVRDLERAHKALGNGVKKIYESEKAPIIKMGKSLVVARDLPSGHVIGPEDIVMKSPGGGIAPYEINKVLGRVTLRPLMEDDFLTFEVLSKPDVELARS